ncbi:MAG TPA: diguanylate cyclase [Anaerolineales bacterium]|nr:diguanylate cyclase [Anaerolineales bacterium]
MDDHDPSVERIDTLTGAGNLLSFLESFTTRLASAESNDFSLLLVDLNNFNRFNQERGQGQGDAVLHWVSIAMKDLNVPVYRIGGDEIVATLSDGNHDLRETTAKRLFERLNRESNQFDWSNPASVMLVHFLDEKLEIADLWLAISDALFDVKVYEKRGFIVNNYSHASAGNHFQLRVINSLTERLLSFASRLDATHQIAYLDPITQLPNSIAAERELGRAIQDSVSGNEVFSILFIDGDNLRYYNDISYSAGDDMLRRLSELLTNNIRPGDFIARWRVGDEFIVLLSSTESDGAFIVAERLRSAVETISKAWEIPITISIGIACHPANGTSVKELLLAVEKAAKTSKDNGKNQITVAPQN